MKKFILIVSVVLLFPIVTQAKNISLTDVTKFTGETELDYSGYSVTSAGDINHDGYDDLLIGAPNQDATGSDAGAVYLIYGKADKYTGTLDLAQADAKFIGEMAGDLAGWSVAGIRDFNKDGFDDFVVGAPKQDAGGSNAGAAYVIYGQSAKFSGTINLSTADIKFLGEVDGDQLGFAVAAAGDANNDGYRDILLGAPFQEYSYTDQGMAYLMLGKASYTTPYDLNFADNKNSDNMIRLRGEAAGDYLGAQLSSAGDLNGDGYAEILLGSSYNDAGASDAGAVYLFSGRDYQEFQTIYSVSVANAKFTGAVAKDYASHGRMIGDVNGDGYKDLLIGAPGNTTYTGTNYLVYGSATAFTGTISLSTAAAQFVGQTTYDYTGSFVAKIGDMNRDGIDDMLMSAYGSDTAAEGAGATYIVYGSTTNFSKKIVLAESATALVGSATGDATGWSADVAGDLNGDGYTDLVTASYVSTSNDKGTVYIVYGDTLNSYEIDDDLLDNDGDGEVDEVNTIAENGGYIYSETNPTKNMTNILGIAGEANGGLWVKYTGNVAYSYPVFGTATDKTTTVAYYSGTGYALVLQADGKKLALVNMYSGEVVTTVTLSTKMSYWRHYVAALNLTPGNTPDNTTDIMVVSKNKKHVLLSLVILNLDTLTFTIPAQAMTNKARIQPSSTTIGKNSNRIKLKSAAHKTIRTYKITAGYGLQKVITPTVHPKSSR